MSEKRQRSMRKATSKSEGVARNRAGPRLVGGPRSSGDPSAVIPPVPIPNTEVKRCSPDDSAPQGCAKVGRCQSPLFFFPQGRKGKQKPGLLGQTSSAGLFIFCFGAERKQISPRKGRG